MLTPCAVPVLLWWLPQSSHKLQVILVCDEPLSRITYSARSVDVGPLTVQLATEMVKDAQANITEEECRFIVDICSGAPVALAVVCNLLRYGHCKARDFIRVYSDPQLPLERSISDTSNTGFLPFESRVTNERLQRWGCFGVGMHMCGWRCTDTLTQLMQLLVPARVLRLMWMAGMRVV